MFNTLDTYLFNVFTKKPAHLRKSTKEMSKIKITWAHESNVDKEAANTRRRAPRRKDRGGWLGDRLEQFDAPIITPLDSYKKFCIGS